MKLKESKISLKWLFSIAGVALFSAGIFLLFRDLPRQNSYADIFSSGDSLSSTESASSTASASSAGSQTQSLDQTSQDSSVLDPDSTISNHSQQNPVAGAAADSSPNIVTPAKAASEDQMRLKIPAINVDAAVEKVGLTAQGALGVPQGPADAAWYDRGPMPGAKGSAVIDGHYGWWKDGAAAVFNNLSRLQQGDKIYFVDEKGATVTFVVREIRTYDPAADASGVFGSNDGKAHLNLITCDGVWNDSSKQYSKRLVVFADKE